MHLKRRSSGPYADLPFTKGLEQEACASRGAMSHWVMDLAPVLGGAQPHKVTAVGFEPTPLRTGALSQRLRPLGQTVLLDSDSVPIDTSIT